MWPGQEGCRRSAATIEVKDFRSIKHFATRDWFLRWLVALVSLSCSLALISCGERNSIDSTVRTDDGRYGTECRLLPMRGIEPAVEAPVCVVPYARLLARPEDFHDRYISIAGYVVMSEVGPVLAPSAESVRTALWYEQVVLGRDFEAFRTELANDEICGPVSLIGKFDAKGNAGKYRLGGMHNLSPALDPLTQEEREQEHRPICVPLRGSAPTDGHRH